ncbi:hypothetical protein [Brevibacterium album]|uniref:hypothetical protein n=1 Tax=Brevibacterium album TaxID=417948 RepID=UPI0004067C1B|nr:hypothetical protein [Brevibacterium album]
MFARLLAALAALACVLGLALPAHAWAASPQDPATGAAQAADPEAAPAADGTAESAGAVVVGASGLALEDLSPERTPHLWSMVAGGAVGNLSVRTLTPATCAASGWLSMGAGARMYGVDLTPAWQHPLFLDRACPRMLEPSPELAEASAEDAEAASGDEAASAGAGSSPETGRAAGPMPAGFAPAQFSEYHRVQDANDGAGYSAAPGAFARAAAPDASPDGDADPDDSASADGTDPESPAPGEGEPAAAWCTAAVGTGAALAAADPDGSVDRWMPLHTFLGIGDGPESSAGDRADASGPENPALGTREARTAQLTACPLTLVDAGTAADPLWDPAASAIWSESTLGSLRSAQIQELDARVGLVLEAVPEDRDVIVAGVGDAAYPSRLRALLAQGPSYPPGTLASSSTRQPGLTQLTDVLPGALRAAGLEAEGTSPAALSVDTSTAEDGLLAAPEGASAEQEAAQAGAVAVQTGTVAQQSGAATAQSRIDTLVADARKAATVHTHAQTFGIVLDVLFYALFLFAAVVFARPVAAALRRRSARAQARAASLRPAAAVAASPPAIPLTGWRTATAWACFALALLPVASFLAGLLPWGRAPDPAMALAGSIAAAVLVLLAAAVAGPWRRTWAGRIAAVCALSAVVLVADVALGSRLQFNSLMGYNPIVAGRFYGLGNQGAALFLVASLLGLGLTAARLFSAGRAGWARALTALWAAASVIVLGNPAWGAKFGGTVAALVGFTVLLLALFRIRVSILRLAVVGVGALAVIVGVAGLDYLRPPQERSHFGNFFAQALDGQLFDVIGRKLEANLRIAVINPGLALVVPLGVLIVLFALAYLRRHPRTAPLARPWTGRLPEALENPQVHAGFLSAVLALAVGLVITDSGIAVPATGAMMLVPLLVVMSLDAAQREEEDALRRPEAGTGSPPEGSAAAGLADAEARSGHGGERSTRGHAQSVREAEPSPGRESRSATTHPGAGE